MKEKVENPAGGHLYLPMVAVKGKVAVAAEITPKERKEKPTKEWLNEILATVYKVVEEAEDQIPPEELEKITYHVVLTVERPPIVLDANPAEDPETLVRAGVTPPVPPVES